MRESKNSKTPPARGRLFNLASKPVFGVRLNAIFVRGRVQGPFGKLWGHFFRGCVQGLFGFIFFGAALFGVCSEGCSDFWFHPFSRQGSRIFATASTCKETDKMCVVLRQFFVGHGIESTDARPSNINKVCKDNSSKSYAKIKNVRNKQKRKIKTYVLHSTMKKRQYLDKY